MPRASHCRGWHCQAERLRSQQRLQQLLEALLAESGRPSGVGCPKMGFRACKVVFFSFLDCVFGVSKFFLSRVFARLFVGFSRSFASFFLGFLVVFEDFLMVSNAFH